jgi:LPS O-antigen subunit length determinant protein (WzzB/FepE family)
VSEIARGYAELLTFSLDSDKQINSLENLLEGVNESYLLQPPTLPQKTNKPRRLMIVLSATIGAGILLLLFVVMRQLLRDTSLNATSAEKIARIRRALGMKA